MSATTEDVGNIDPLLLPDRHEPYCLHDVLEKVIDGCRDEIVLSFGDCFLKVKVEPNTDSIEAQFYKRKFGSRSGYF